MARTRRPVTLAGLVVMVLLGGVAAAQPAAPKLIGPFTREDYPQAVIDRPLTLPAGMVEGESGWTFASQLFADSVLGVEGVDDWFTDLSVRVGVTDRLQIEAGTAFSLGHRLRDDTFQGGRGVDLRASKTSWQRIVPVRLSLLALDTDSLDTAVTVTVPFVASARRTLDFGRGGTVVLKTGDGRVVPAVGLAAPTRWRLTDWLWLRAGEDLFQVTTGDGTAIFAFLFGVGVQAHRMFAVTLDSRIATIAFDGGGEEFSRTVADDGTIDLEGTFSPCRWFDVVGSLGLPDVGRGFDDYVTRLAFRVRI